MTFKKDISQYPTLSNNNPVAVTLENQEWGVVIDWMTHVPFDQSRALLEQFRDQTSEVKEEDFDKPFTAVLSIEQYNQIIGSLSLAPYYIVAELIVKIHTQATEEIEQWRNLYNTVPNQK